ncbi:MAG: FtsW/RodA/SpoVE family cell cycle protein [Rhodothermaceae bacterium]
MKINYKINDRFDFLVFIPVIALICLGLVAIYSATANHPAMSNNFNKQLIFAGVALVAFFVVYFVPYNLFRLISTPAYLFSIFLLILVLLVGRKINGAVSWLSFGPVGFQPAEFAKLGTILFLASFLSKIKGDINNFKDISLALLIGGIPMFLILLQPDVGTLIVFTSVMLVMIFWSGISLFSLFVVLSPGIVVFASMFDNTYIFLVAFCFEFPFIIKNFFLLN